MAIREKLDRQGFTLLELMLTLLLCSFLVLTYTTMVAKSLKYWQYHIEQVRIHENLHYALHYVEKNLRQFNQQEINYVSEIKQIKGENSQGEPSYMDFRGDILHNRNTYLYYQKGKRQIHINRNREHNVLARNIDQLDIEEIVSGSLIKVSIGTVDTQGEKHVLESKIRINPRR